MSSQTIVFFDLDGTITPRDTYKDMLLYGLIKRPHRAFLIIFSVYDFILYKIGKNTNTLVKKNLLKRVFGKMPVTKASKISCAYAVLLLKYSIKKQALVTLNKHKKKGDRVVLVSASFDFYVNEIAKQLGIDEVIATKAEVENNKLTGRLDGENCYGTEKIVRIKKVVNLDDYSKIITYTDHHSDLPLLNIATAAYAVCPSRKLQEHVDDFGGKVLLWS